MEYRIAPSILAADFARLGEHVRQVEQAGADLLHIDVMDGHFVPNLSMGPIVVEALRRVSDLPLDVHLMLTDPERYIGAFIDAGASLISFHVEVVDDPPRVAAGLRERGIGAGLVLNPETPVERALAVAEHFDMILVMTVHPGFGGQGFLADNLEKIRALRQWDDERRAGAPGSAAGRPLDIEIDGGIGPQTISRAARAGANIFVAGNAVFGAEDPAVALSELRRELDEAVRI